MTPLTLTMPPLRLRPITEAPASTEILSALIVLADETPGDDNIGAHLADELFVWLPGHGTWTGEMSSRPLPRNARWWLPETELTATPSEIVRRDATIHAIWEDA
jgi:hypothetical protein